MRFLVDTCQILLGLLLSPVALFLALTTGKYRSDWAQRMGRMPDLPAGKPRVWIHAVSVGEVNAVRGLVAEWRRRRPDLEFVISTTTDTGQAQAQRVFPDLPIIRYPLDVSWWVSRALRRIKPTMIVLVELEVWFQLTTLAAAARIPVLVVNGRLSARSEHRFRWVAPFARRMFGSLAWVGAQDETYARRFCGAGVPADRVTVTGSMKWDGAQIADSIPGSQELAQAMGISPDRPLWVCGSTGPGEEQVILDAHAELRRTHPGLQLAIIPRKPERFDEVAQLIQQLGFQCLRRSASSDGRKAAGNSDTVYLGDTMGELRKFYSLASVTFVGRSLAAMGGSDMMEVAALAKPIVVGPHTENFEDTVRQLAENQGITIIRRDLDAPEVAGDLATAIGQLLVDPPATQRMADNGRHVVRKNLGATQRTLEHLMEILNRAQQRTA